MDFDHVLGILIIAAAYGFTWYLLVKSTNIVRFIAREGLLSTRAIKNRLKNLAK
jgi:small neutral amino acid transporter SnatA (MarC family)